MKPILESITQHRKVLRGHILARSLCFGMVLLANHAMAGLTYRMAGATCTDSNHSIEYFPDGEGGLIEGAGPIVCDNHAFIEVEMQDGYVPGTMFERSIGSGDVPPIESFSYRDGARTFYFTFQPFGDARMFGWMPEKTEPSNVYINTNGWGFFTRPDGTWNIGVESAAGLDAPCSIVSTEGPGGCRMFSGGYSAVGTYRGWHRVPEPTSINGMVAPTRNGI